MFHFLKGEIFTQTVPALTTGSSWCLGPIDTHPSLFVCLHVCVCVCVCMLASLTFCHHRCSRLILYISFPNTRISHFPRQTYFLLLEDGIRSQDLGVKMCLLLQVYYCFKAFPADEAMKLSCVYYPVIHICVTLSIGSHLIYTRLNMSSYSCLHF